MRRTLHVANLPGSVTETALQDFFSQAGAVTHCRLVVDRRTGRCRGSAFVEMSTKEQAELAVHDLHGHHLDGRAVSVREAKHVGD